MTTRRFFLSAGAALLLTGCSSTERFRSPRGSPLIPVASVVPVDGGTLHVESVGTGSAVLLIHGGFGDRRMWDAQFTELASRYRVIRVDLRGFGASPTPTAAYDPVGDIATVLDHLGVPKAHFVGNSMGGALAIDVALAHPDRVSSLTVVSSGPNGFPLGEDRPRYAKEIASIVAVFEAATTEGVDRAAALWEAHPMVSVARADRNVAPRLHAMLQDNRQIFLLPFWPDDDKRAVHRLEHIVTPTLLIVGDKDIELVQAAARFASARIPGARLVTMAGTDHLPQMEQPERFNQLLAEFLRTHE
ncbi:alpha/beta fold hydrolase [Tahibacter amnicola]|uniref:Alpha/beta hydrolase n=1 Tax=Tahibacter amnicola TaxID=2976241 RepID=A0ABY6B6V7_9GAMM|nr:alpha/beta hydrolase [Tahibacter amnicola]UXI65838.1 alpha/beta hydrolase [Tahibacter amnicola]